MADLSIKESSQTVSITGINSSGVETNFVDSTTNGALNTVNRSNNGGTQTALTVGTTAVELKCNATVLTERISATLSNTSGNTVYWGFTSGVTTTNGTPIEKSVFMQWDVGPNTSIWLIAASAGNTVRVTECA